jgi:CHAD domain-containing protein
MMQPPRLLDTSAASATRRIALHYLADAAQARRRLRNDTDDEALHDLRVALRRLRSTLRAYRPWINSRVVPRKLRRRLKRLARMTNAARDAEVALRWVRTQRRLALNARAGVDWFAQELELRRHSAYADIRSRALTEFDRLHQRLRLVLRPQRTTPGRAPLTRLRDVVSRLVAQQAAALEVDLRSIRSPADAEIIHAARIETKRLRYLLEPLASEIDGGVRLIARLKRMQDVFGEMCDRHVFGRELIEAARRLGGDWAVQTTAGVLATPALRMPEPQALIGILLLVARVRRQQRIRFRVLRRRYSGTHIAALLAPIRAVSPTLADATPR